MIFSKNATKLIGGVQSLSSVILHDCVLKDVSSKSAYVVTQANIKNYRSIHYNDTQSICAVRFVFFLFSILNYHPRFPVPLLFIRFVFQCSLQAIDHHIHNSYGPTLKKGKMKWGIS